jgi:hypothetical protein
MSDNYLRLVPVDPKWSAPVEAAEKAVRILAKLLPAAGHVCTRSENGVVFYDAGANTESISCPACGSDLGDWWGDAMDEAFAFGFTDLTIVTPCCAAQTSLNDLIYVWPAAFGSFALEATNPGVSAFTDAQKAALEEALGAPLKTVWQHL